MCGSLLKNQKIFELWESIKGLKTFSSTPFVVISVGHTTLEYHQWHVVTAAPVGGFQFQALVNGNTKKAEKIDRYQSENAEKNCDIFL